MTSFTQWQSSWNQQGEVSIFIEIKFEHKGKHCHFFQRESKIGIIGYLDGFEWKEHTLYDIVITYEMENTCLY